MDGLPAFNPRIDAHQARGEPLRLYALCVPMPRHAAPPRRQPLPELRT